MHSKTNLLTLHCGEEKCRVDCKATNMEPSKENGQLGLRRPELPSGSQGSVFKGKVKRRVLGPGSAHTQFSDWLIVRLTG